MTPVASSTATARQRPAGSGAALRRRGASRSASVSESSGAPAAPVVPAARNAGSSVGSTRPPDRSAAQRAALTAGAAGRRGHRGRPVERAQLAGRIEARQAPLVRDQEGAHRLRVRAVDDQARIGSHRGEADVVLGHELRVVTGAGAGAGAAAGAGALNVGAGAESAT